MFETLFTDSVAIARYRDAPLLEDRLRYLSFRFESGASCETLRPVAAGQMSLVRLLDLRDGARVSAASVAAAADGWSRPGGAAMLEAGFARGPPALHWPRCGMAAFCRHSGRTPEGAPRPRARGRGF